MRSPGVKAVKWHHVGLCCGQHAWRRVSEGENMPRGRDSGHVSSSQTAARGLWLFLAVKSGAVSVSGAQGWPVLTLV